MQRDDSVQQSSNLIFTTTSNVITSSAACGPTRQWCETNLDGGRSRLSSKLAFVVKVNPHIADYALSHELLHFITTFGSSRLSISCGRQRQCSPACSLETRAFSVEYWKWQHHFLLDAVMQHGPLSLFLTISLYEWSFPLPPWLTSLRQVTGKGPTDLPLLETSHIVHILEQIIRAYLCGSNDKKWSNHVFNYNRIANYKNVETYFYRFEFQNRGTVHVQLLV